MTETISLSLSEDQWRQQMLDRIIDIEALTRANFELTKQVLRSTTKADLSKIDKAANELVADYRKGISAALAASILSMKSE